MAAPVLGGMLISDEVIDLLLPVLFYGVRKRRWLKLQAETGIRRSTGEPHREPEEAPVRELAAAGT
jgi:Cu(I)/Ag(I) efflux system membrane protein CusA/SilA